MIHLIDDNALIRLLKSSDYVERFKGEYYFVERKLNRLENMLEKWRKGTLDFEPKTPMPVLEMQAVQMRQYLATLESRAKIEGITFSHMDGVEIRKAVYIPEQRI